MSFLTLAEASRLLAARAVSPVELTTSCLDQIRRHNATVCAFITVTEESALAEARKVEAEIGRNGQKSPLHGIPVALKDIFWTRNVRTTAQSAHLINHIPTEDAAIWGMLRRAGAILVGKTTTHEFAFAGPSFDLPFPNARNPWDPQCFAAGSSSGNAVAIACGMAFGAIGSDTGGSIRSPAALCGVVGLKPTYGLVSRYGAFATAQSLDHVGPMAWNVEDCALLLQQIAGFDQRDVATSKSVPPSYAETLGRQIKGRRLGIPRRQFETDVRLSAAMARALEGAFDVLRDLGADLVEIDLPSLAEWKAAGTIIMLSEAFAVHEPRFRSRPDLYGELMRDLLSLGALIPAADYINAQKYRRTLTEKMCAAMTEVDAVIGPTQAAEAPRLDAVEKWRAVTAPSFTLPYSLSGYPAISLCCGYSDAGLPLALQIAAKPFQEQTLLQIAYAYEHATAWRQRRPALVSEQKGL